MKGRRQEGKEERENKEKNEGGQGRRCKTGRKKAEEGDPKGEEESRVEESR